MIKKRHGMNKIVVELSDDIVVVTEKIAERITESVLDKIIFQGKDIRLHNTKLLMRNYNTLKEHLNNSEDGVEIRFEFEDEAYVKVEYRWLESIAKSKTRTAMMMNHVDEKLKFLENKFKERGEEEKYRAFEMFYIGEVTSEKIAEKLHCSKNTSWNWVNTVSKELSILLFGIDALVM